MREFLEYTVTNIENNLEITEESELSLNLPEYFKTLSETDKTFFKNDILPIIEDLDIAIDLDEVTLLIDNLHKVYERTPAVVLSQMIDILKTASDSFNIGQIKNVIRNFIKMKNIL